MSDTWIVLLWLPLMFVVGGMLGYRIGVIHGYDRAEAMLEEITAEQYRRLTAKSDAGSGNPLGSPLGAGAAGIGERP